MISCVLFCLLQAEGPVEPASEPASQPASVESLDVFDILKEDEEVYTGARGVMKVREAGSSVWVIDRATIEATAAAGVPELLRMIPGIYVRELSASSVETHTRFPVLVPDNQTLFLIDGRSLQFDVFGYTDKMGIEVYDIERIEVIMGPSSTLYGTNAYAGVVNIVTKQPSADGTQATAIVRGGIATGSRGEAPDNSGQWQALGRVFADATYNTGAFGLRVSAGADYLPSFDPNVLNLGSATQEGLQPHKRFNAALDLHERKDGWLIRQRLSATFHDAAYYTERAAAIRFQDYALTMHASRANLAKEGDELSIIAWGRYVGTDHTFVRANNAPAPFDSRSGSAELFAQYKTPKFFFNQLSVGTQLRFVYVGQDGIPENARFQHVYGLFAEDTFRPIDRLVFTAGIRLEANESPRLRAFSRFNVAPRGSVVWLITDDHSLRFEAASAFRNPSVFESFAEVVNLDGIPWFQGNSAARSEEILQISLGYNGRVDWFRLRAELLAMRVTNVILPLRESSSSEATEIAGYPVQLYPNQSGKLPAVFVNIPDVFWIPAASLRLEADIKKVAKVWAYYHYAPLSPEHLAGLGAQLSYGRVSASTQVYFVGSFLTFGDAKDDPTSKEWAARVIWNAQVAVNLDEPGRFKLALAGTNLVDNRFYLNAVTRHVGQDYQDGERIGQRLWLELRAAF
jgi:outer membrane receptor protein involved in Fe transport